jgi:hypothetical protein
MVGVTLKKYALNNPPTVFAVGDLVLKRWY